MRQLFVKIKYQLRVKSDLTNSKYFQLTLRKFGFLFEIQNIKINTKNQNKMYFRQWDENDFQEQKQYKLSKAIVTCY